MIMECPLNMECRLVNTVDMAKHDVFIGEIVESYCDDKYLVEGSVDFSKVDPIIFAMYDPFYFNLGERFAKAWAVGKELKSK
jgi:flavin reductase (DIM6/NTAB) family NADH-FMN oxidoreductase RutF